MSKRFITILICSAVSLIAVLVLIGRIRKLLMQHYRNAEPGATRRP